MRSSRSGVFLKEINVLLVEDNVHDVFLAKAVFEDHEITHTLHVIGDGRAAIDYVDRIGEEGGAPRPDLLLLDINLPKVNGIEVLTHFRSHQERAHIPVIVFSSSAAPKEQAQLAELRFTSFFQKPIDYAEFAKLGTIVREAVEG